MLLTIDNLAQKYSMLPTQVLTNATTFDLCVLDVSTKYVKYQHDKENAELIGNNKIPTQSEMIQMLKNG